MFNVGYDALASFFIDKALFPYYNVAAVECKCNRIANLRIKIYLVTQYLLFHQ